MPCRIGQHPIIRALVEGESFRQVVGRLRELMREHPQNSDLDARLEEMMRMYDSMVDYFVAGVDDPDRERVFAMIARELYVVTCKILWEDHLNAAVRSGKLGDHLLANAQKEGIDKTKLERYVQDKAMLTLGISIEQPSAEKLYEQHHDYLNNCFLTVLFDTQWKNSDWENCISLLLGQTIEEQDQAVLISAITLSCVNCFDMKRMQVLHQVFQESSNPSLRKRAFIGMVLSWHPAIMLFDEGKPIIATLLKEKNAVVELLRHMIRSNQADRDVEKIKSEILPHFLDAQQQGLNLIDFDDLEGSSINEILHPEQTEETYSALEDGMNEMMKMLNNGADIYFGQFAQMKRAPFFSSYNNLINWFLPFDPDSPLISQAAQTEAGKKFLHMLASPSSFCDSDKYSLALNLNRILPLLPSEAMDMLSQAEALGPKPKLPEEVEDRIDPGYVKDLYRFYRLYHFKDVFRNPFDVLEQGSLFASLFRLLPVENDSWLLTLLKDCYHEGLYEYLKLFFEVHPHTDLLSFELLRGKYLLSIGEEQQAMTQFEDLYRQHIGQQQVMLGLAHCYQRCERYSQAEELYLVLKETVESPSAKMKVEYSLSLAQVEQGKLDDAIATLFRLHYQQPEQIDVARLLLRALLLQGKLDQATAIASQLGKAAQATDIDRAYAPLILFLQGHTKEAVEQFPAVNEELKRFLKAALPIFQANQISAVKQQLFFDALQGR